VQLAFSDQIGISLLLILPLLKLAFTAGCLGSGASGGLFTPTMTIGALLGGLLGHTWNRIWPGASMGSCSVIGSCAFLAAATHGPLSALVLVLELTRHIDATMVPMLLAVAGAVFVVRRIEIRSVYSVRLHLDEAAERPEVPSSSNVVCEGYDVVAAATGYAEIVDLLLNTIDNPNRPIYVVDDKQRLIGRITQTSISAIRSIPIPLDAVKAADIFEEVDRLTSTMTQQQMSDALRRSNDGTMPVVEPESGQLIGIFRAEPAEMSPFDSLRSLRASDSAEAGLP